ncbi:MAG TPA: RNA polymerase sigma factor SigW [Bacilli bacterium]
MDFVETRLAQLSRNGDRRAFGELVDLYRDKIHRLAVKMLKNTQDSEDIVQETFIRVYLNLNRYDDTKRFSTWIYKIGKNLCIDLLRKKKETYSLDADITEDYGLTRYEILANEENSPETRAIETEAKEAVNKIIQTLPEKYRSVLILHYIHDMSLQEIGNELKMPVTTVKTRLHRGRDTMRKRWGMTFVINHILFLWFFLI